MSVDQTPAASTIAVCTLWEGDYHKGMGSLVNSLFEQGFRGRVWAGYRGALPDWAAGGRTSGAGCTVSPVPGLEVIFVKLETTEHFAHYKPQWCRRVLEVLDPTATGVFYFDPDIFAMAEWTFFERWLDYGIAVCEDSSYPLNPTHPIALGWLGFASTNGYTPQRAADFYLNSGLVGLKREHLSFLDIWEHLFDCVRTQLNTGSVFRFGTRASLFHSLDQDTFTLAAWLTEHPVSYVGPDGMGFDRGVWLVVHAIATRKPWRRQPVRDLLRYATQPDISNRLYWQHAAAPIAVEPAGRIRRNKLALPLAAVLGRFYRRPGKM